jgi:hypothetical protein
MGDTSIVTCPISHHKIANIHNGKVPSGTVKAGGQDKPAPGKYIKWDAEGVEVIQSGEQEKIKEVSDQFNRFQMMNFNEHMHCLRGTHLKTQGVSKELFCAMAWLTNLQCVMGKFIVQDNLPEHLAQGMFKKPGVYDVIMRYSSLTPKIVPDNAPAPRGIGMKIFGIEGEKIWGEDKKTQDWTFNNYPVLELRDPQTTYDIADALERNWNDLPKFAEEQSKRVDADVATLGGGLPKQHSTSITIDAKTRKIQANTPSVRNARVLAIRVPARDLRSQIRRLPTLTGATRPRRHKHPRLRPHQHHLAGDAALPHGAQSHLLVLRTAAAGPHRAARRRHRHRVGPPKIPLRAARNPRVRAAGLVAPGVQDLVG